MNDPTQMECPVNNNQTDFISSTNVPCHTFSLFSPLDMCGVEMLSVKLRQRRLKCFGHRKRAENSLFNEVEELKVSGRQLVGRPKKKWRACLIENMNTLGTQGYMVQDHQLRKANHESSIQLQPKWETMDIKH